MLVKRIAAVSFILFLGSTPAWCSSIDFESSGDGGTWSWYDIYGSLTATSLGMAVQVVGSPNAYPVSMPDESFTSGPFFGGSGTTSSPWTFAPTPFSFAITGCVPPGTTCAPVTLFTGQFNAPGETAVQEAGSILLTAASLSGTVDPALLSFLGLPASRTSFAGTYDITLTGTAPGSGLVASGDVVLSPTVPEPSSLALLGIGLFALACVARRTVLRT